MSSFLDRSYLFLQVTKTTIEAMDLNFGQIPSPTMGLAAIERLEKTMYNVTSLSPSFLIVSSSFLQVNSTVIKSWMCLDTARLDKGLQS